MLPSEYLALMDFPEEWNTWDMIPSEWLEGAISTYEPGMEMASEHDRNGAFHWWLKRNPTTAELAKLWQLSLLDPDQIMAESVRGYIRRAAGYNSDVESSNESAT